MKKNTLQKMMLAATLLTLVSCTQDELMKQSTALPDGVYPITFTAVQALPEETPNGTPQTRVSDNGNTSSWTNGDKIKVTVNGNGYTNEDIVCTLNEKGEVTQSDKQLYWQSAEATAQFTGVYPEKTENIPLNGQGTNLAYVMRAPEEQGSYKKPAQLKFKHQLAKLCVTLQDEKGQTLTGSDHTLSVLNYASCDNTSGGAQGKGNLMFIPMRYNAETQCYEANIVPGTFDAGKEFYRIQKIENGKATQEATAKLTKSSTFTASYVYSATVTAKTSSKWVPVITDRKEYNIENDIIVNLGLGSRDDDPTRIKVAPQKNVTVTIRKSKIGSNSFGHNPPIGPIVSIGAGATVTLKVEDENYFHTRSGAGIEMQNGSSLTIIGDGGEKTKLSITTTGGNNEMGCPCIGSAYNKGGTLELESITIKDVKLDLTQGGNYGNEHGAFFSSPAIGLTHVMEGNTKQSCKSIKIENSEVKITNNGDGACIGTPGFTSYVTRSNLGYNIDEIIIASSTIDATSHGYGACIGFEVKSDDNITGTIGTISINTTDLKFKKTTTDSGAFCVGRGQMNTQVNPPTITKGISIDGKDEGKEGYDPPMQ